MIYYIADTHFSDPNILVYSRTQFKNVDEMNKLIIEQSQLAIPPLQKYVNILSGGQ